ncbi:hypothetical protein B0H14DRAFT_3740984 [Mycena olivaceomarginata]|nr:hypothetical protein B0H14DRAFT_3740984 [Mycena olivaceomarginata]
MSQRRFDVDEPHPKSTSLLDLGSTSLSGLGQKKKSPKFDANVNSSDVEEASRAQAVNRVYGKLEASAQRTCDVAARTIPAVGGCGRVQGRVSFGPRLLGLKMGAGGAEKTRQRLGALQSFGLVWFQLHNPAPQNGGVARQGSPAPIVGVIRPCPPDTTVSSDSDEGSPTPEVTKSPNTRRVVQCRKIQPGQPELEPLRYDAVTDSDMPASTAPARIPSLPPSSHFWLGLWRRRLHSSAGGVAAAAPLTTPVDSRSTTPPPRTAHHSIRTEPPSPRDLPSAPLHTANPPFKKRSPRRRARQRSPHRAIYRWLGAPHLSAERPPEVDIVRVLERSVSDGNTASCIQGVSWTPAGHLAIYTRAPFWATQLAPFFPRFDDAFKGNFRSFGGFGEKRILDVDTPWIWGIMDSEGPEI